jgi:hypothetical protein
VFMGLRGIMPAFGLVLRRGETAPHRDSRPSVVKACLSRLQWELVLGCLWLLQSELRNVVKTCSVFSSVHARKYGPATMDWSCVPCVPEQLMATLVRWAWSTQSFSLQRHQQMLISVWPTLGTSMDPQNWSFLVKMCHY